MTEYDIARAAISPLDILQTIAIVAFGIYGALMQRALANLKRIEALDTDVQALGERLAAIEQTAQHAPTHADIAAVYTRLNNVAERLAEVSGTLEGLRRSLERIDTYLLNHKD